MTTVKCCECGKRVSLEKAVQEFGRSFCETCYEKSWNDDESTPEQGGRMVPHCLTLDELEREEQWSDNDALWEEDI